MTLTFGIYAGGRIAVDDGSPVEDPVAVASALDRLHGDHPFLVRAYVHYPTLVEAPPNPVRLLNDRRRLDLVVCFREPGTDLAGWLDFIRKLLREHGSSLAVLQITEEPNNAGPGGDGGFSAVRRALVEGVVVAKREAVRLGLDVLVGCNATPGFDPAQEFWTDLGKLGGQEFRDALDYVGIDLFPDVFQPIAEDELAGTVRAVLAGFRGESLAAAGISETTPIHVTEHGWSTGAGRSPARQAEVLDTVVRVVAESGLNITTYEHFALRDADSRRVEPLYQLGLLCSDHTPKPAFATYRELIAEFTVR
ncbi:MAG TPA: hypothetical protein VNO31_13345 [Umezawaea sp.]|nr:hypothetical protein [Umezawaea sp.]